MRESEAIILFIISMIMGNIFLIWAFLDIQNETIKIIAFLVLNSIYLYTLYMNLKSQAVKDGK